MKILVLINLLLLVIPAFAFEGIIHCTKTENGQVSTFEFYVKGNQLAIISENGAEKYRILVDRNAAEVKICLEGPQYPDKGYYVITKEDVAEKQKAIVYSKTAGGQEFNGSQRETYAIMTNIGSATAISGTTAVNLTGLSVFFSDPVYELIDVFQLSILPELITVMKATGNYQIRMEAEEKMLDAGIFEVPAGYKQFTVTASSN